MQALSRGRTSPSKASAPRAHQTVPSPQVSTLYHLYGLTHASIPYVSSQKCLLTGGFDKAPVLQQAYVLIEVQRPEDVQAVLAAAQKRKELRLLLQLPKRNVKFASLSMCTA